MNEKLEQAIHAALLAVIEAGCTCESGEQHPWELDDSVSEDAEITALQRVRFVEAALVAIEKRL